MLTSNKKTDLIKILKYKRHTLEYKKNKIPLNEEDKIFEIGKQILIYDDLIKLLEDHVYFNNLKKYYGI